MSRTRPMFQPPALTIRYLLAACALGVALGAAAQDTGAYVQASQEFDALRAAHPERLPRLADADAAPVLRTLADAPRFLPAKGSADLAAVSDLCDRAQSAVVAYLSFGALQQGQLVPAVMSDNAAAYQDELALLQPFLARCVARQVPLAEATLRQLDPRTAAQLRLGGLRRGQAAILQLYASLATGLADPRVQARSMDALLDALADTAPAHARALALDARAAPRELAAAQVAQAAPARQAAWRRIASAMADTGCEALCALAARNAR